MIGGENDEYYVDIYYEPEEIEGDELKKEAQRLYEESVV